MAYFSLKRLHLLVIALVVQLVFIATSFAQSCVLCGYRSAIISDPANNNVLNVYTDFTDPKPDSHVFKAFDGNNTTNWNFQIEPDSTWEIHKVYQRLFLTIELKEYAYVRGLEINYTGCKNSTELARLKNLSVSVEAGFPMADSELPYKTKSHQVELDVAKESNYISLRDDMTELIKRKILFINVNRLSNENSHLCISEIKLDYGQNSQYKAKHSWSEIYNYIVNNKTKYDNLESNWGFIGDIGTPAGTKFFETYFHDFVFYALSGNKEAYSLFIHYNLVNYKQFYSAYVLDIQKNVTNQMSGYQYNISKQISARPFLLVQKYSASSTLGSKNNRYSVSNIHDNDLKSAWCEGSPIKDFGDYVVISNMNILPSIKYKFYITPGYQKDLETYLNNSRPSEITLYAKYYKDKSWSLLGKYTIKPEFGMDNSIMFVNGSKIIESLKIVFSKSESGKKYKDMCVSEINAGWQYY